MNICLRSVCLDKDIAWNFQQSLIPLCSWSTTVAQLYLQSKMLWSNTISFSAVGHQRHSVEFTVWLYSLAYRSTGWFRTWFKLNLKLFKLNRKQRTSLLRKWMFYEDDCPYSKCFSSPLCFLILLGIGARAIWVCFIKDVNLDIKTCKWVTVKTPCDL